MYVLVLSGPPGSGKSTYAEKYLPSHFLTLSTDQLILNECARQNKTYDEVFPDYMDTAHKLFEEQVKSCNNRRLDFIIDQTGITEKSRKRKLQMLLPDAKKIAIYFPAYTPDVLKKRIDARVATGGHNVPMDVIEWMHRDYRLPQKTEGFDLCISSSHFLDVIKIMDFK